MEMQEQLIREVTGIGNGAHIFVPRDWLNQKVLVIKTQKLTIKEQIIKILEPHLDNIIGIFLYGSYARGEQEKDSDIDVLLVVRKKFKLENKDKISFEIVEYDQLKKNIELNPLMFYPIIQEAKPIINSLLLEELRKIKFNKNAPIFKWFVDTTKDQIKSSKELIELDKLDSNYLSSYCVVYSIILRLRGIFIIRRLLFKRPYTTKLFKEWLIKNILDIDYNKVYNVYKAIRDHKQTKIKIKLNKVEQLLNLLQEEINKLKEELHGK